MTVLAFLLFLNVSHAVTVTVLNCVTGEDTLDPADHASRTIAQWQDGPDFAGVPVAWDEENLRAEVDHFLSTRTFLGRELVLIRGADRGRVIEARRPGVLCLLRTGQPKDRRNP